MVLSLAFLFIGLSLGQDQDTVDFILSEKSEESGKVVKKVKPFFEVKGSRYYLDMLNRKGPESFEVLKRDGVDILSLFDVTNKVLFKAELDSHGPYSRLHKISMRDLSKSERMLVLYHYEGVNKYLELKGSSRLYFLTWNIRDTKSFKLFKGPIIWNEFKDTQDRYFQRKKRLQVMDLDNNGYSDVVVKYGRVSEAFAYFGNGDWKTFKAF